MFVNCSSLTERIGLVIYRLTKSPENVCKLTIYKDFTCLAWSCKISVNWNTCRLRAVSFFSLGCKGCDMREASTRGEAASREKCGRRRKGKRKRLRRYFDLFDLPPLTAVWLTVPPSFAIWDCKQLECSFISVKWGWLEYTTPRVRDICTFAVLCLVTRPFLSLYLRSWKAVQAL